MKLHTTLASLVVVALLPLAIQPVANGVPAPNGGSRLVVRVAPGTSIGVINAFSSSTTVGSIGGHNLFLIELPPLIPPFAIVQAVGALPGVEWVELDASLGSVQAQTQSFFVNMSALDFQQQFLFDMYKLDDVHEFSEGDGIIVALLDTWVDDTHDLLVGRVLEMECDFAEPSQGGPMAGHGTFLAALIAAVAPEASILPIRVLNDHGTGSLFNVVSGILCAIDSGASIINLSIATTSTSSSLNYALELAAQADILVVAAAGNQGSESPVQPAAHPLTLAVTATNEQDVKSSFSNYGAHIDITALGRKVVSAMPGNLYARTDGTSPAAALVSGAAALIRAAGSTLTASETWSALIGLAVSIEAENPGYTGLLGSGRLELPTPESSIPELDGGP